MASLKLPREPLGPSSRKTGLAITEIMYHPLAGPPASPYAADDFEYIEVKNIGGTPLSLIGEAQARTRIELRQGRSIDPFHFHSHPLRRFPFAVKFILRLTGMDPDRLAERLPTYRLIRRSRAELREMARLVLPAVHRPLAAVFTESDR